MQISRVHFGYDMSALPFQKIPKHLDSDERPTILKSRRICFWDCFGSYKTDLGFFKWFWKKKKLRLITKEMRYCKNTETDLQDRPESQGTINQDVAGQRNEKSKRQTQRHSLIKTFPHLILMHLNTSSCLVNLGNCILLSETLQ